MKSYDHQVEHQPELLINPGMIEREYHAKGEDRIQVHDQAMGLNYQERQSSQLKPSNR